MEHIFTKTIKEILVKNFAKNAEVIFEESELIQYLNFKTKSANKGSKARGSFANLYAIYVIIEDYITQNFHTKGNYSEYEGALFSKLFKRQRELPFGSKLQNHALNNRMNAEFQKFFPNSSYQPILRNLETNRYWINENLLKLDIDDTSIHLATSIIEIIDNYVQTKQNAFESFVKTCEELQKITKQKPKKVTAFIYSLLKPNVDARLFEIVSYAILKYYYKEQSIFWGFEVNKLKEENLSLYKTGRTNANDGGIDFVMKPLGRFFQVSETLDFKKYFLDIDKIQKFPITFVIKSEDTLKNIYHTIRENATKTYSIKAIVDTYMNCIEEIINIPELDKILQSMIEKGNLKKILDEIVLQSKLEFNQE